MPDEIVRQPIRARPSSRRKPIEHFALQFPRLALLGVRIVQGLRPSSVLRRSLMRYFLRLVFEAANREDYEAAFMLMPDDFEMTTPAELVGFGFEPTYRGRDERIRFQRQWTTELGEFHQEPAEIIDMGDRIVMIGRMHGVGVAGGVPIDSEVAYLVTFTNGRVSGEQPFRSHAEAFEAAGLTEP